MTSHSFYTTIQLIVDVPVKINYTFEKGCKQTRDDPPEDPTVEIESIKIQKGIPINTGNDVDVSETVEGEEKIIEMCFDDLEGNGPDYDAIAESKEYKKEKY